MLMEINGNHGISSGFEGSGEHRRHLPPSKNLKSQCIICKKYIVKQNMKDHARKVHRTTEAKVSGHKSVRDMFAPRPQVPRPAAGGGDDPGGKPGVTDSVGGLKSVEDNNQNIAWAAQEDVDQIEPKGSDKDNTDDYLLPATIVRIISKDASEVGAVDASCWTQEEKENLLKQIQSMNIKMAEMQISMASRVVEEVADEDILEAMNEENFIDKSRSVKDLVDAFVELSHNEEKLFVSCIVCNPPESTTNVGTPKRPRPGVFFYTEDMLEEYQNNNMPRNFRNLKKSIKRHFSTTGHTLAIKSAEAMFEENQKFVSKTQDAGMRCGRWLYHIFSKGRPYSDYPDLIATDVMNGAYCGNINHSEKFPPAVLPHIAEAIKKRKVQFLTTPLVQTGFRVPIKIVADKDTRKHRTRQLVLITLIVPDSPNLIQAVYLGHPVVDDHSGPGVAQNLIAVVEKSGITAEQVEGQSYDGQYFHLSVHTRSSESFWSSSF